MLTLNNLNCYREVQTAAAASTARQALVENEALACQALITVRLRSV
jgi:hypothetical protein